MDKHGLPLQLPTVSYLAQLLLSAHLSIQAIVKHHPKLKSKYTQKYDYQCAKCEDSKLIKSWFAWVRETIEKNRILMEDVYNMDESGF